ncbi:hypothetical protein SO694_0030505 [Aureococcus anophagefferens]|uniref:Helicase-associated domain-containing protein n=1 Tax=Aureococcus anophagefferens TaxID=44056 RepID=A0ABR1FZR9_AURAN
MSLWQVDDGSGEPYVYCEMPAVPVGSKAVNISAAGQDVYSKEDDAISRASRADDYYCQEAGEAFLTSDCYDACDDPGIGGVDNCTVLTTPYALAGYYRLDLGGADSDVACVEHREHRPHYCYDFSCCGDVSDGEPDGGGYDVSDGEPDGGGYDVSDGEPDGGDDDVRRRARRAGGRGCDDDASDGELDGGGYGGESVSDGEPDGGDDDASDGELDGGGYCDYDDAPETIAPLRASAIAIARLDDHPGVAAMVLAAYEGNDVAVLTFDPERAGSKVDEDMDDQFGTCLFSSRRHVRECIAKERDPAVKAGLERHLAKLIFYDIDGVNYLHYAGAIAGGSTFATRGAKHRDGSQGYLISRAASSPTLSSTFVHVRVSTATCSTVAYQLEALMGQAFGLGRGGLGWNRGFLGPCRYEAKGLRSHVHALNVLLKHGEGESTCGEGVDFLRDLGEPELAAQLDDYLRADFQDENLANLGVSSAFDAKVGAMHFLVAQRGGTASGAKHLALRDALEADGVGVAYVGKSTAHAHAHAWLEAVERASPEDPASPAARRAGATICELFEKLATYADAELDGEAPAATVARYRASTGFVSVAESGLGSAAAAKRKRKRGANDERRSKDVDATRSRNREDKRRQRERDAAEPARKKARKAKAVRKKAAPKKAAAAPAAKRGPRPGTNQEAEWSLNLGRLAAYKAARGTCAVPRHHVVDGAKLGTWVDRQRTSRRRGALGADRIARLDALGFAWLGTISRKRAREAGGPTSSALT